ncbi:DEAD/DEAH box helicase [Halobacillus trueperi]|uniref:DEAD/DEAH box helicase n=1 Tax=Halobacillus trueperi TaxID=156205 RepID=UPI00373676E7
MFKTVKKYLQKDFSWIPHENPTHSYPSLTGKLLLRHEIPYEDEKVNQLIAKSILTKVTSIESYPWGHRCRRCGNTKFYLFAKLPHATCGQDCLYCRSCIQMGRVIECKPLFYGSSGFEWPVHEHPCQWDGELTIHQQKAADELVALVRTGNGEKLVWAVCGAGKTEILFPALTEALKKGKRICLATPRTDVVRELLPRLQKSFPEVNIQALYGDSPDKAGDTPFIIATTHQLLRFAHAFDVMIIDEVDAFPFHNDVSLHYASERAAKPQASTIYLTATPRKKQKRRIRSKDLPVVFIPQRFHGHPLPVPQLKLTPTLHRYLQKGELPLKILQKIVHQQQTPRQLLLFLPSIKMAEQMASYLKERNYDVQSVHAEDSQRAEKIQSFRKKEYRVLITTTILERGVTFPSVDVYVIDAGHVVFDEAALVQIAGRAGRSPDDPTGEVIFYHIGKTDEMLDAVESIRYMNKLGRKL